MTRFFVLCVLVCSLNVVVAEELITNPWDKYIHAQLLKLDHLKVAGTDPASIKRVLYEDAFHLEIKDNNYLTERIHKYGMSPYTVEGTKVIISDSKAEASVNMDFSVFYKREVFINQKVYVIPPDLPLEEIYKKYKNGHFAKHSASLSDAWVWMLFPITALTSCDNQNEEASLNVGLASVSLAGYCLSPVNLAITASDATCRGIIKACKTCSVKEGFCEMCKNLPVIKETRIIRENIKKFHNESGFQK